MKSELFLGDAQHGVGLSFDADGLTAWGYVGTIETMKQRISWADFDQLRRKIDTSDRPTLYETYKRERTWDSSQPDLRSFVDAIHFYFPREQFALEGQFSKHLSYEEPEEHLCLMLDDHVIWDFGALYNQPDLAYSAAFRRFEDNVETIRARAKKVMGRAATFCTRLFKLFGL